MTETLETTTTYTKEIISKAAWLYWKKIFAPSFIASVLLVFIALMLIVYFDAKNWISGTFLALSILSTVIFFWAFFIYRNRSMATFVQMDTPIVKWTFTEERIFGESDAGKSEFKWNILKGIIKSKDIWLLIFKNNSYSVFPTKNVSNDVLEYVSNKIKENSSTVKQYIVLQKNEKNLMKP